MRIRLSTTDQDMYIMPLKQFIIFKKRETGLNSDTSNDDQQRISAAN